MDLLPERVHDLSLSPATSISSRRSWTASFMQWLVRSPAGYGVVDIDDTDDLRQQRDFGALQAVGIARPIKTLMVVSNDRADSLQRAQVPTQVIAQVAVPRPRRTLPVRGKAAGILHDHGWNCQHANIVQKSTAVQRLQVGVAESES